MVGLWFLGHYLRAYLLNCVRTHRLQASRQASLLHAPGHGDEAIGPVVAVHDHHVVLVRALQHLPTAASDTTGIPGEYRQEILRIHRLSRVALLAAGVHIPPCVTVLGGLVEQLPGEGVAGVTCDVVIPALTLQRGGLLCMNLYTVS